MTNSEQRRLTTWRLKLLQAGMDLPYQAIRVQEADAINLVLHLGRVHGRRTVTELVRVRRYVEQLVGYRADDAARKIAACAPLSIKATLTSAHQYVDPVEADALSKLGAQYAALYRTEDFIEGRRAEAEGRPPKYRGR